MSLLLRFEIDGLPPSVNSMYRTGRVGNRYKRPEVTEWQEEIAERMRESWGKEAPYCETVEVRVIFFVGDKRRWDIDNRLKALLDCLELGGVINNDMQIWGLNVQRVPLMSGQSSMTQIEVRKYEYAPMLCKSAE